MSKKNNKIMFLIEDNFTLDEYAEGFVEVSYQKTATETLLEIEKMHQKHNITIPKNIFERYRVDFMKFVKTAKHFEQFNFGFVTITALVK